MQEVWKSVEGFEGKYEVSNLGRVKSIDRIIKGNGGEYFIKGKMLKPVNRSHNYLTVALCGKHYYIHKLVAQAFIPNLNNYKEINHIDGDQRNNCVENLEWCTHSYNMKHSFKIGLHKKYIGKYNKCSKKVNQYDLENNFIKKWDCINDVERELKIKDSNISRCCKNLQKTAGGYVWKYEEV